MKTYILTLFIFSIFSTSICHSSSIEKANMMAEQGLIAESKKILINIIFDEKSTIDNISEALYELGVLNKKIGNNEEAIKNWNKIISNYPESKLVSKTKKELFMLNPVVKFSYTHFELAAPFILNIGSGSDLSFIQVNAAFTPISHKNSKEFNYNLPLIKSIILTNLSKLNKNTILSNSKLVALKKIINQELNNILKTDIEIEFPIIIFQGSTEGKAINWKGEVFNLY